MIVDLKQNTPEWLAFRINKIGASDVPSIMGVSPWTTAYQLWEKKLGLVTNSEKSFAMQRGASLESDALKCFNDTHGVLLQPKVVLSKKYEWAMASLDGFDEDKVAVEIKCPGRVDHEMALNNKIPDKYYPQLQHQMFCAGIDSMWYFSYDGSAGCTVFVPKDENYQAEMIKKEIEFYKCMKEFIPPAMTERDYVTKNSPEFLAACAQYRSVRKRLKELENSERDLRVQLVAACCGHNTTTPGLRISRSTRRGSVDYGIIPELRGIDLDQFRNDPIISWRITDTSEEL